MPSQKVLVIGGTGFFGRLLVDDLLRCNDCELIVASRHPFNTSRFRTIVADLSDPHSLERALGGVAIAVCAAGPYQKLPVSLAERCVERNIHYIDLADDRVFVQNVRSMAVGHQSSRSAICTGWSTVSALSGLLTKIAAGGMPELDSIQIQMAPGNRGARQLATIASLLHSVGQPFRVFRNGAWHRVVGWSESRDFIFPSPIGRRCGYLVDVPDHEMFPEIFRARTVEFRAGSELRLLNGSLSVLRLTGRNWVRWSGLLQAAAGLLSWIGHDAGAIGVEVSGAARRRACIVADSQGERIAVMPASVMTRRLLSGSPLRGVISYTDWLKEEQLRVECERRGWRLVVEEL
jgi:hypothetical protein